jgi:hypothetical protein
LIGEAAVRANAGILGNALATTPEKDEDDDGDDEDGTESHWHHHHPHSGRLPEIIDGQWSWPCMFLYPSHNQSDFIENCAESEMMAMRMV